jgi:predicted DNA-binding WGR domain protein
MVVDQRGKQIVRRSGRVEVAGEVQIDVFHRHHLRITAAGRAAFHAE